MNNQTVFAQGWMNRKAGNVFCAAKMARGIALAMMLLTSLYGAASAHSGKSANGTGEPLCEILSFCDYHSSQSAATPAIISSAQAEPLCEVLSFCGSLAGQVDNWTMMSTAQTEPMLVIVGASGSQNSQYSNWNAEEYSVAARMFCQTFGICNSLSLEAAASITNHPPAFVLHPVKTACQPAISTC